MKYFLIILIFFSSCSTRKYGYGPVPIKNNEVILASSPELGHKISVWDYIGVTILFVGIIVLIEKDAKKDNQ